MNRPLLSVVIAYAGGLLLAQLFQPPPAALIAVSLCVMLLVLVLEKLRPVLFWPLLALAGWTNFVCHTAIISPHDLRTLFGNEPELITLRGELAETPRLKISVRDEAENWRNVARVRVAEIRRTDNFQPAAGEILVATPGIPGPEFFAGQTVEISGVISRPPPPLAEGLFDYKNYLALRGSYYQLKAGSTNDWKLLPPVRLKPPRTDRFLNWSKATLALGLSVSNVTKQSRSAS